MKIQCTCMSCKKEITLDTDKPEALCPECGMSLMTPLSPHEQAVLDFLDKQTTRTRALRRFHLKDSTNEDE